MPGLEEALEGKEIGESLSVIVPPEKAYGERREELVGELPRAQFPEEQPIEPGMMFHAQTPNGTMALKVLEADDEKVKVDGNHELAGQSLHFDVEVKEVREATEDEKQHGHVHQGGNGSCGDGGCGCQ